MRSRGIADGATEPVQGVQGYSVARPGVLEEVRFLWLLGCLDALTGEPQLRGNLTGVES